MIGGGAVLGAQCSVQGRENNRYCPQNITSLSRDPGMMTWVIWEQVGDGGGKRRERI